MRKKKSIAIALFRYSVEVSPTVKNICTFLNEKGWDVTIVIDRFSRNPGFTIPGVRIIEVDRILVRQGFSIDEINANRELVYSSFVARARLKFDLVLAVDYWVMKLWADAGWNTSKMIFLSVEGVDYIMKFDTNKALKHMEACPLRISQSPDRAAIINRYFGKNLSFSYLPVSMRPVTILPKEKSDKIRIIYSGYFAEWACLLETLLVFRAAGISDIAELTLQGHAMGTDAYLAQVMRLAADIPGVEVDLKYYSDEEYMVYLAGFDIGLAFYRDLTGTDNFSDMLRASGKAACYSWLSMSILTNLKDEMTANPPFLYVEDFSPSQFRDGILRYIQNRDRFAAASKALAEDLYNFDNHMTTIIHDMEKLV